MLLLSTEMRFGAGPEPTLNSLFLAHEIFKPSGAASVKLDSLVLASSADGSKSGVISIHEIGEIRSSNLNAVLHGHVLQYPINGNAEACRSYDAVLPDNRWRLQTFGQFLPNMHTRTCVLMRSTISWSSMSGTPDRRQFDVKVGYIKREFEFSVYQIHFISFYKLIVLLLYIRGRCYTDLRQVHNNITSTLHGWWQFTDVTKYWDQVNEEAKQH